MSFIDSLASQFRPSNIKGAVKAATRDDLRKTIGKLTGKGQVYLTGVAEADEALANFPPEVQKKLIRAATKEIGTRIQKDAQRRAPKKTGAVAEAIKVVALMNRRKGYKKHRIGVSIAVGEKNFVGDQFYGGFLEFGTKDRYHKKQNLGGRYSTRGAEGRFAKGQTDNKGKFVGRIREGAFAFLRPALYANRQAVIQSFGFAVRQAVQAYQTRQARASQREWKKFRKSLGL